METKVRIYGKDEYYNGVLLLKLVDDRVAIVDVVRRGPE